MIKKIAFISEHASPLACLGGVDSGGQNVYVAELARQLVKEAFEVDIFTRCDDASLQPVVQWVQGVRIIHVKAGPALILPKEEIFDFMPEFAGSMLAFIGQEGLTYDLIHAHFWMSAFVASILKSRLKIPFVITFHALAYTRLAWQKNEDRFPQERFEIEKDMVSEADQLIAVCPQDREDLISHYGADPEKITIIPCGFNPEEFYPVNKILARMVLGIEGSEKIILQLGRMVERKGIDNVIRALGILKKEKKQVPRLLIVGGETDNPALDQSAEMKRLRLLTDSLDLDAAVSFMGRKSRDTLKYFYSAADIFITTPWYEPFGITPLEAMACGTPVIGSDVGGIKFSVRHNETGLLVEPREPAVLAGQISTLLAQPVNLSRFAENGRSRSAALFTWKEVARQMSVLYSRAFHKAPAAASELTKLGFIEQAFRETAAAFIEASSLLAAPVLQASALICESLESGNKILICGNGGSAAESQHLAAELVGRFKMASRRGLPAISLAADTAVITAWANDFSFDEIFSRQLEAIGQPGDLLVCLSTSGCSANILEVLSVAARSGIRSVLMTGKADKTGLADLVIQVPSENTPCIQEIHLHIIHLLCDLVEKQLFQVAPVATDNSVSSINQQLTESDAYYNSKSA